ncbi:MULTISPECIES: UbiA prenyltransferase family protein [unclassified Nonomuraea]|uniref:UbiA prenyltransferase family protein n=1 Tax=unclassified Nonomuraea TaxID=2593643 RepID=UPI0033DCEEA3
MGSVNVARERHDKPAQAVVRQVMDLFLLARPTHWAKSMLVVPIALVDVAVWSWPTLERVAWSIAAFILAAAVIYLVNDLVDKRLDRLHPGKCQRPIAAGRLSATAVTLYGVVLISGLSLLFVYAPHGGAWPVLSYLVLNLAYCAGLKRLPLIDMGVVSTGFVLRVVQGYLATEAVIPGWLLIAVFSGSLLLILGKRRYELVEVGAEHRPSLRGYSVEFLNHLLMLASVVCLAAMSAYLAFEAPIAPHRQQVLLISLPFVLYALSRYLQVVLVLRGGGDPVRLLLRDRALIVSVGIWVCALAALVLVTKIPSISAVHSL